MIALDRGAIAAGALAAAAASIALAAATLPCRAAPPASSDDGHEEERLRQLRLGQLRTRAKAAGVDEKTVAGALDADEVLERSAATAGGTTTHGLRSELDAMRPGELHLYIAPGCWQTRTYLWPSGLLLPRYYCCL